YLFFLFISLPCSFCPLLYLLSFYHLCLYEHIAPTGPEALVATLADWGAEHRPQEPCSTCGCTLYWTAAGDVMCAICLPMPRLTEGSRERIARLFPRTLRGAHESAGRPAVRVSTGASARPA